MFRQKALDRLSSPDELDQLMHITSARLWLALVAVAGLLVAGAFWTVFTTIPTTVSAQGALVRSTSEASVQPVVFATLQDGSEIKRGQRATLTLHNGELVPSTLNAVVTSVDPIPADETSIARTLHNSGYAHVLATQLRIIRVELSLTPTTSGPGGGHNTIAPGTIVTSSITVDRQSPIHLIIP